MKLKAIALAVSGVLLAAPSATAAQSSSGQDLAPEERGAYVAVSGAFQLYEKRAAELALEKARRPEVRAFAEAGLADQPDSRGRLEAEGRRGGRPARRRGGGAGGGRAGRASKSCCRRR